MGITQKSTRPAPAITRCKKELLKYLQVAFVLVRTGQKSKSGFCRCPSSAFARNQSPTPLERFRSRQKSKYRLLSVIFQRFSWLIGFLRFSLQGEPPLMQWKAVVSSLVFQFFHAKDDFLTFFKIIFLFSFLFFHDMSRGFLKKPFIG